MPAGDDDEFTEFVHSIWPRLMHAAYLLTGDRHQAEDAAQTALANTFAVWSRLHRRGEAYAYTRKVLTNHVIDGWRRPIREQATDDVPELPARGDLASDVAQREWLVAALGRLTGRERAIVVLRHFLDLPEAEVAAELNISVGTVKATNSRALNKLRVVVGPRQASLVNGEGTAW